MLEIWQLINQPEASGNQSFRFTHFQITELAINKFTLFYLICLSKSVVIVQVADVAGIPLLTAID